MDDQELRVSLTELRRAIDRLKPEDTQARERLEALAADLERRLAKPDDGEHHETLLERLGESIDHLRLEHPKATDLLNRILTSLGGAGI
jgi:signal transduction histidine kinase